MSIYTARTLNERQRLHRQMLDLLSTTQDLRPLRPNPADWIKHEREVMFDAVNSERAKRSLEPVTKETIERVEGLASGHVDYSRKFALYCAELAMGEEVIRP